MIGTMSVRVVVREARVSTSSANLALLDAGVIVNNKVQPAAQDKPEPDNR